MARNDISIDFSIPHDFPIFGPGQDGRSTYFVPLLVLRKWPPLLRLDLRGPDGSPFPLLTTSKNEQIDAAFLVASAPASPLREAVATLLSQIPSRDTDSARDELIPALTTLLTGHAKSLTKADARRWAETLRLGASLASNMLLWARVEARPTERLIIKVAYEIPLAPSPHILRRIGASLGWAPLRLQYVWHDMSGCGSYHVQIEPPDGLEVHRALLRMVNSEDAAIASLQAGAPRSLRLKLRDALWTVRNTIKARWWFLAHSSRFTPGSHGNRPPNGEPFRLVIDERAYLYVSGNHRGKVGAAEIDLATSRRGLKRGAAAFSLATTSFLAAMTATLPGVVTHVDGVVPALLITPALLAFVIANPGEHPLVRYHLSGVRIVVALVAGLPVAATVALLSFQATASVSELRWCWGSITAVSLMLTALLLVGWLLPPVKDSVSELFATDSAAGGDE